MYLIRVDDFPRIPMNCEEFLRFHTAMQGTPYLLAVIPRICTTYYTDMNNNSSRNLTEQEIKILKKIAKENVSFAFHGLTHKTTSKENTEFIGLSREKTEANIKEGLKILSKLGISTNIIVPPFNTFDLENIQSFKKYFKIVTGGPETIKIFGKLPIGNLDGILYIPSYKPFYGKAKNVYNALEKSRKIICITLHWGWEIDSEFRYVKKMIDLIKDDVIKWDFNTLQTILY